MKNSKLQAWHVTFVLSFIYTGLKLAGVIDWSWWWVFSPLWIGTLIGIVALFFLFISWLYIYFLK